MSIPASRIVTVNPAVVTSGGNPLLLNGLFLTENTQMPVAKVFNFTSAKAVASFFGPASLEAAKAVIYFAGYLNSTRKPTGMLFAPYNLAARAAFLQSGTLSTLSLSQLQALSGTLILTVNGTVETSSNIVLTAATSYSNAATIIQAAFTSPLFTVTWNPTAAAFVFTSNTTGIASTISYASGTLASGLDLTQALGAFTSQGAALDTPVSALNTATAISQNFATVVTLFEPSLADKQTFAGWFASQNDRYLWLGWDSDPNASVAGNQTCFGALAELSAYDGVMCLSGDPNLAVTNGTTLAAVALDLAVFVSGGFASIDFTATNGRRNAAFMQPGTTIGLTCDNDTIAQNLLANGYSFYGRYATPATNFSFLFNGQLPGQWKWADPYIDQIWLNGQLQLALMTLVTNSGFIPYNPTGYASIRTVCLGPIQAAINFGAIQKGVTLSATEIVQVNQAAGLPAASVIATEGYYLQILDPGATARGLRQTPIINLWYADGGSIQQITLASIDVQ